MDNRPVLLAKVEKPNRTETPVGLSQNGLRQKQSLGVKVRALKCRVPGRGVKIIDIYIYRHIPTQTPYTYTYKTRSPSTCTCLHIHIRIYTHIHNIYTKTHTHTYIHVGTHMYT